MYLLIIIVTITFTNASFRDSTWKTGTAKDVSGSSVILTAAGSVYVTKIVVEYQTASSDTGMEAPSVNTVANVVATLPHKEN